MSDPLETRLDRIEQSQERLHNLISEIEDILETLINNDTEILEALAQILTGVPQMQARNEQSQARLTDEIRKELRLFTLEILQQSLPKKESAQTPSPQLDAFAAANPEVSLLQFLYSFLPDNVALDIGANTGDVSERLLATGFTVYAFEPNPAAFAILTKRFEGEKRLHAFPFALGPEEKTMDLHVAEDSSGATASKYGDPSLFSTLIDHPMPGDLPFNKTVPVQVRTLDSLYRSGKIPKRVGVVKIDTEGFDLEVIRGMSTEPASPILMAEFWDAVHSFGRSGKGRLEDLVKEMKGRGYHWHIVIYHVEGGSISYFCNQSRTVPNTWGNVLFFREQPLFVQAYGWCEKALGATLHL